MLNYKDVFILTMHFAKLMLLKIYIYCLYIVKLCEITKDLAYVISMSSIIEMFIVILISVFICKSPIVGCKLKCPSFSFENTCLSSLFRY